MFRFERKMLDFIHRLPSSSAVCRSGNRTRDPLEHFHAERNAYRSWPPLDRRPTAFSRQGRAKVIDCHVHDSTGTSTWLRLELKVNRWPPRGWRKTEENLESSDEQRIRDRARTCKKSLSARPAFPPTPPPRLLCAYVAHTMAGRPHTGRTPAHKH